MEASLQKMAGSQEKVETKVGVYPGRMEWNQETLDITDL